MAEPLDLSVFPASVQAYATVGVSIVLGIVGIYGYYKKLRGDPVPSPAGNDASGVQELLPWLSKLLDASTSAAQSLKSIEQMMSEGTRQYEIDRAYQKGRDDRLDRMAEQADRNSRGSR